MEPCPNCGVQLHGSLCKACGYDDEYSYDSECSSCGQPTCYGECQIDEPEYEDYDDRYDSDYSIIDDIEFIEDLT